MNVTKALVQMKVVDCYERELEMTKNSKKVLCACMKLPKNQLSKYEKEKTF